MTLQERNKILEMFLHKQCDLKSTEFVYSQSEVWEAVEMAAQALENQIPKKPKQIEHIGTSVYFNKPKSECTHLFRGYCPNCNTQNTNRRIAQVITYCERCGQALDWSDTE